MPSFLLDYSHHMTPHKISQNPTRRSSEAILLCKICSAMNLHDLNAQFTSSALQRPRHSNALKVHRFWQQPPFEVLKYH
eukprot:656120-Amphidinium_carterae.1